MTRHLLALLICAAAGFAPMLAHAQDAGVAELDAGIDAPAADAVAGPAPAPVINPADEDPIGVAQKLYQAIAAGKWLAAIGFGLLLFVSGARFALIRWTPWGTGRASAYVLALLSAALTSVGIGLANGAAPSLTLFVGALALAWVAAGQWEALRDALGLGKKG
jgi:hypothetical protein